MQEIGLSIFREAKQTKLSISSEVNLKEFWH